MQVNPLTTFNRALPQSVEAHAHPSHAAKADDAPPPPPAAAHANTLRALQPDPRIALQLLGSQNQPGGSTPAQAAGPLGSAQTASGSSAAGVNDSESNIDNGDGAKNAAKSIIDDIVDVVNDIVDGVNGDDTERHSIADVLPDDIFIHKEMGDPDINDKKEDKSKHKEILVPEDNHEKKYNLEGKHIMNSPNTGG